MERVLLVFFVMTQMKTILIVEDDPSIRRLAKRMLAGSGIETLEADNGAAALETLECKKSEVDAALVDLRLPDIQGDELIGWIRNTVPGLPVILFTGNHLADRVKELLEERNTFLLNKPFTRASLLEVVDKALASVCHA